MKKELQGIVNKLNVLNYDIDVLSYKTLSSLKSSTAIESIFSVIDIIKDIKMVHRDCGKIIRDLQVIINEIKGE